ncbi:hypothetical protein [Corynebacterium variabile]|uniref:hypothetical protein n=1 Tax=Corynebacterium variabile TaxID=1727 RepID=UPI003BAE18F7
MSTLKHIDPSTGERWEPVTNGGCRSHPVFTYLLCYADGDIYDRSLGRYRKQTRQPNGYLTIGINGTAVLSHRLILESWYGMDIFDGNLQTRHKLPERDFNWIFNLNVGTAAENIQDAIDCGNHNGARTVCSRGHALVDGNLVLSQLKSGSRSCLSCHRGRANAASQAKRTGVAIDVTALRSNADRHYRRLQRELIGDIDESRLLPLTALTRQLVPA